MVENHNKKVEKKNSKNCSFRNEYMPTYAADNFSMIAQINRQYIERLILKKFIKRFQNEFISIQNARFKEEGNRKRND